jgi:hypothetical protein
MSSEVVTNQRAGEDTMDERLLSPTPRPSNGAREITDDLKAAESVIEVYRNRTSPSPSSRRNGPLRRSASCRGGTTRSRPSSAASRAWSTRSTRINLEHVVLRTFDEELAKPAEAWRDVRAATTIQIEELRRRWGPQ